VEKAKFGELLTLASRHLAEANNAISEQKKVLSDLINEGRDTAQARDLLEKLEASAEAMAEHERAIQPQIHEFERGRG
jgi:bisphosphoglycerate-independent phosphoglycerate mutase (AlkP superfamily)